MNRFRRGIGKLLKKNSKSIKEKYANQFRALESYTVDGTTTGELDPTKVNA